MGWRLTVRSRHDPRSPQRRASSAMRRWVDARRRPSTTPCASRASGASIRQSGPGGTWYTCVCVCACVPVVEEKGWPVESPAVFYLTTASLPFDMHFLECAHWFRSQTASPLLHMTTPTTEASRERSIGGAKRGDAEMVHTFVFHGTVDLPATRPQRRPIQESLSASLDPTSPGDEKENAPSLPFNLSFFLGKSSFSAPWMTTPRSSLRARLRPSIGVDDAGSDQDRRPLVAKSARQYW